MDLITSKNGYSDYKRKTIEEQDDAHEESPKQSSNARFQSYL
ncbi:hypothetical protein LY01_01552 [Nonlabens xylanidelens]|uniref:Uncharacterized protein n=1 Tax=Nonlabens xylanidelens TaxID=191564 RepID=A0A2S6IKX3_9FLAO|nr:hypothetical protein LY01_01552 [Nonlabens xylanidelens]